MPGENMKAATFFVWSLIAGSLLGSASGAEPIAAAKTAAMPDLVREYEADLATVAGFFRVPGSDVGMNRRAQLAAAWLSRLQAVDFNALDPAAKIDYLLLANHLNETTDHLARERKRIAETDRLLPFRKTLAELETARWRAAPLDYPAVASQLSEMAKQTKQLREETAKAHKASQDAEKKDSDKKEKPKPADPTKALSPVLALRAGRLAKELRETLKQWHDFYSGYQPDFDWWIKKPHEEASKELDEYAKLLIEEIAGQKGKDEDPLVGDPIGREAVAADVRFEFLPYSAEELIAIGQRELAWGQEQMKAAAKQMGLGDDWKAALAKVKANHVPPGGQDSLIEQIGREATDFVKRRDLVTVPPLAEETWRLTMIPPKGIKTVPYAAYGDQQMQVAYAKDEMSQEDKLMVMRGNNRHFMRLVTPHELIPGHHLQHFYAARYNNYRGLFATPFYFEGWALYWELRLWDLGWAQTPEDRIGMLFWRNTRAARIIVSLKYHLGQMKPDEMVAFLRNEVGHEKLGATSEVRRFIAAEPLYQAGYMIGGLQFYAMHKELVGAGRMTERAFHDAVLTQGAMPVELLRAAITQTALPHDAKPAWRFTELKKTKER